MKVVKHRFLGQWEGFEGTRKNFQELELTGKVCCTLRIQNGWDEVYVYITILFYIVLSNLQARVTQGEKKRNILHLLVLS